MAKENEVSEKPHRRLGRPPKIHRDPDQPQWVCHTCGIKHGAFKCGQATWHMDNCGCCGEWKGCTEPRDFGYLLLGWKEKRDLDGRRNVDEDESR